MEKITHLLFDILVENGIQPNVATYINMLALLLTFMILIFSIDYITRKVLIAFFTRFAAKTKTDFDDILITNKTPRNLAHIIPYVIAIKFIPIVFYDFLHFEQIIYKGVLILGILLVLSIARSVLHSIKDYFKNITKIKR